MKIQKKHVLIYLEIILAPSTEGGAPHPLPLVCEFCGTVTLDRDAETNAGLCDTPVFPVIRLRGSVEDCFPVVKIFRAVEDTDPDDGVLVVPVVLGATTGFLNVVTDTLILPPGELPCVVPLDTVLVVTYCDNTSVLAGPAFVVETPVPSDCVG